MVNLGKYKQVVIWGAKLFDGTHSYIHYGIFRGLTKLGVPVQWMDSTDLENMTFTSESIVITEAQVEEALPLSTNNFYLLHSSSAFKYQRAKVPHAWFKVLLPGKTLDDDGIPINGSLYYASKTNPYFYMPWATDILSEEVLVNMLSLNTIRAMRNPKEVHYVGTIWDGIYGNYPEIIEFRSACYVAGIDYKMYQRLTMPQTVSIIRSSLLAPAIQGHWQIENHYIPCRIMKNISYGHVGITNSKSVYEYFDRHSSLLYEPNAALILEKGKSHSDKVSSSEMATLMDTIRHYHTYEHRMTALLNWVNDEFG